MDDAQLLRRYVEERSQEAFAELVRRHVNVVYFAALRRVGGDAHLADDVAQSVFSDLARKAASLQTRPVLAGWLYTSTRFAAAQAVRSERRRRTHEQEAYIMHELHSGPEPDWNRLRPVIDEAMDELSESDREAVLLRFFENRPLAEVGARFSLSADAARMRVERALDKLRGLLAKRGIASTPAALAAAVVAQSGLAVPANLAARIAAGSAAPAGSATVATLALWKILAGVAAGVCGIGLAVHEATSGGDQAAPAAKVVSGYENVDPQLAPVALAPASSVPVTAKSAATSAAISPAAPAPVVSSFGEFSVRQKNILKTLWEHQKISPDKPPLHWGFKPGVAAAGASVAGFEIATHLLRTDGLVGLGPRTGVVFLTEKGRRFCEIHARELDDYSPPGHIVRPASSEKTNSPGVP